MSVPGSDLPTSILFCRLCQSLFRQPRVLPCLHTFCLDCLTHLAPTPSPHGHPSILPCPLCGQHAPLPPGGVSELTSNDFLARICQEYVGEVQKTLVSRRSLSPGAGVGRPGQMSPVSVIAGRVPVSQFHYPSPSQVQPSSPPIGSPGAMPTYRERALSPSHSPLSESSFRGRPFSRGMSHSFHRGASPASSPGYLSPSGAPSSPRHSCSSSSSEAVLRTARRLSSEVLPSRGFGIEHRLSTTPQEVVRTWECLQRKLNSLQSASLQVTYSLETLNMAEANWHQRKQDLRRDVQRRSAQLQFFIKRQERLLLAALDARKTDDSFNSASEHARGELRTNLKALMHETDVVKSVLDLATDSEIMALSKLILTSKVSQAPVTMETPELHFVMPEEVSLEDMVGRDFGCLTSTLLSHTIFTPEDIRQELPEEVEDDDAFSADTSAPLNLSSTVSPSISDNFDSSFEHVAFMDADEEEEEEEEMVVEETLEFIDGKMQVVSKRSIPSSSSSSRRQPSTDSRARQDTDRDRDGRETSTRGRATDTRRTVNSSALMTPSKDRSWESTKLSQKSQDEQRPKDTETPSPAESSSQENKMEKFQNLRESLKQKRRELLLNTPLFPPEGPPGMAHLLRGEKRVQSLDRTASMRDDMTRSFSSSTAPKRPQEPSIAAPVIHTPTHSKDSKNIAEGSATSSVSSDPGTVLTASLMSTSLLSPRASVPTADTSSRPVRRAISAASDRASKMEYLRETWRKRKELLIQNEAYIPAPSAKPAEEKSTTGNGAGDAGSAETEVKVVTSSQPPKSKIKHSIRSRISHLKQALKMNGKSEEGSQAAKTGDKDDSSSDNSSGGGGGGGGGGRSDIITSSILSDKPITATAHAAAEKKVLKTLESILQKTAPGPDPACKPALSSPPAASDPSPGSKPSMLVKPCPREPTAAAAVSAPTTSAPPLETLQEDDARGAQAQRKPGLRVTSPVRGGEATKETLQHLRANIRQKKERWRSLSLN